MGAVLRDPKKLYDHTIQLSNMSFVNNDARKRLDKRPAPVFHGKQFAGVGCVGQLFQLLLLPPLCSSYSII
jgi:hypothetical protein